MPKDRSKKRVLSVVFEKEAHRLERLYLTLRQSPDPRSVAKNAVIEHLSEASFPGTDMR